MVCLPLSEANAVLKKEGLNSLFRNKKDEGVTLKQRGDSFYTILYNDLDIDNPDRIRWTVMHELGHVFLNHLNEFEKTAIHRGGLTEGEYGVLEIEAHMFAAEMFAPTPVMLLYNGISEDQLRVMCGLSEEAAAKRYTSLYLQQYHPPTSYDQKIIRNFSAFMHRGLAAEAVYKGTQNIIGFGNYIKYLKLSRKCPHCYSYTTIPSAKYCIYCGEEFVEPEWDWSGNWYGQDDDELVQHPSPRHYSFENVRKNADWEHDKFQHCPVCQNEEISVFAEYCQICGQRLRNMCVAEDKSVSVKARYCPDCGSETTFKAAYESHEATVKQLDILKTPEEWLEYDYWDYIIGCVRKNRELVAALDCAKAFTDDDEKVYIIAAGAMYAKQIEKNKEAILRLMKQADGVTYEEAEVYTV